ncbi:MAG: hypothetical protein V1828_04115 [Candidatus Omnitrophota bacterium]
MEKGRINMGVVELRVLAIEASMYLIERRKSQNPPKTLMITMKDTRFNKFISLKGVIQPFSRCLKSPHTINPMAAQNMRIKVAVIAEAEVIPIFARIIPADVHRIDNKLYLTPKDLFLIMSFFGIRSDTTQATPLTVRNTPPQANSDNLSPRIKIANMAVTTGVRAPIKEDNLGPRCIKDIK